MDEGYVIDGGTNYYCSDDCLHTEYTDKEWNVECKENPRYSYWTQWDVEFDAEYETIDGILTEI